MNIAFPALFLFILVLPGFICRASYFATEKTDLNTQPFSVDGTLSFIIALCLHFIWMHLAEIWGYPINLNHVFSLLSHSSENAVSVAFSNIAPNIYPISVYFISLYVGSWGIGVLTQYGVRWLELDAKLPFFKFDIPWYYQFRRVVLDVEDETGKVIKKVVSTVGPKRFVMLTCAVTLSDETYLYIGVLEDFFFKKDGTLDRVVLNAASRRKISDDESALEAVDTNSPPFHPIQGDKIIIKYDDISSLNIEYFGIK